MLSRGLPTLDLDVRSRRIESLAAWLTLALGAVAPLLLQVDLWMRAVLIVLSASVIAIGFRQAGWWGPYRLLRIVWLSDGRWMLSRRDGPPVEVRLLPDSRRAPACVWLRWQREQSPVSFGSASRHARSGFGLPSRYAMLLGNGDLPAAEWRRLRMRLAIAAADPRPPALDGSDEVLAADSGLQKFRTQLMRLTLMRSGGRCALNRGDSASSTGRAGVASAHQASSAESAQTTRRA
jgi:hypothetical protein